MPAAFERAKAKKNPASFETGQFTQACAALVAVAISMPPVAIAVGIGRGSTNDSCTDAERNPTAIVPVATAAMMTVTVTATVIAAVSVMPAAVSIIHDADLHQLSWRSLRAAERMPARRQYRYIFSSCSSNLAGCTREFVVDQHPRTRFGFKPARCVVLEFVYGGD